VRRAAGLILAAVVLVAVVFGVGWRTTRPPPPNPLDSWKGPSADPLENKLRKLTFDDGRTARLRVPSGWSQHRAEAIVVLLPDAGETGAAVAGRYAALLRGPWLVLVPEGPPDAAFVTAAVARVQKEYRADADRVLVVGQGAAAPLAEHVGCRGGDVVLVRHAAPCGESGTAWGWIGRDGLWEAVDEPTDPDVWLAEEVARWAGR